MSTYRTRSELPLTQAQEVADGVFAYAQQDGSWWINTTGFVVGADRVTAVDACATEARTRALLDTVRRTTPLPVRTLVNTHFHGDHTYGNSLFEGATIIGHTRCREEVLADTVLASTPPVWEPTPQWGDVRLSPPDVTFEDRLTLWVGDREVQLLFVGGPAHTDGDVVVWLPAERVLFAGDLAFAGGTPMMMMGSVTGSVQALERLTALGAETVVPGHGSPTGPEVFARQGRYVEFVLDLARDGVAAGVTPLELARETDLGEFAELLDPERIVLNLHRAYADLDPSPDATVDVMAAFGDAVAWSGGPLRCLA